MASPGEQRNPRTASAGAAPGPDFETWACRQLRSVFPDQTAGMPEDELQAQMRSWAVRCGRYGFETEEQVLCFAVAGFLIGGDFDSDPNHAWAAEVLTDAELSADERAAMVVAIAELLVEDVEDVGDAEAGDGESG